MDRPLKHVIRYRLLVVVMMKVRIRHPEIYEEDSVVTDSKVVYFDIFVNISSIVHLL